MCIKSITEKKTIYTAGYKNRRETQKENDKAVESY